jgi:hypothetical protein
MCICFGRACRKYPDKRVNYQDCPQVLRHATKEAQLCMTSLYHPAHDFDLFHSYHAATIGQHRPYQCILPSRTFRVCWVKSLICHEMHRCPAAKAHCLPTCVHKLVIAKYEITIIEEQDNSYVVVAMWKFLEPRIACERKLANW